MNILKFAAVPLVAAALVLTGGAAAAAMAPEPVSYAGASDASGVPGGLPVAPSFTITLGGTFAFAGMDVAIQYDATKLAFDAGASSVTVDSVFYTLPTFYELLATLKMDPRYNSLTWLPMTSGPGNLELQVALSDPLQSVPLTESIVVSPAFTLLSPAFAIGSQTAVEVTVLNFYDAAGGAYSLASAEIPITMTITAVPEPETWLMLLAGMGLVGSVIRRRSR